MSKEKKERPKIFGLGLTQLIHWMRDKKFTLAQARHVFRAKGVEILTKPKSHGALAVSDHAIRAHLHCFPRYCKKRAPRLDAPAAAELLKLKKETPKDEPIPSQIGKEPKPPKAAKKPARVSKAKRSAAKPGKAPSKKRAAKKAASAEAQ